MVVVLIVVIIALVTILVIVLVLLRKRSKALHSVNSIGKFMLILDNYSLICESIAIASDVTKHLQDV